MTLCESCQAWPLESGKVSWLPHGGLQLRTNMPRSILISRFLAATIVCSGFSALMQGPGPKVSPKRRLTSAGCDQTPTR